MNIVDLLCEREIDAQEQIIVDWAINTKYDSGLSVISCKTISERIKSLVGGIWPFGTDTELIMELDDSWILRESYLDNASRLFIMVYGHSINLISNKDAEGREETISGSYDEFMQKMCIDAKYKQLLVGRPLVLECCKY